METERRRFVAGHRNGYGAVDEYLNGKCLRTVTAGLKPAKLADEIAAYLNAAYWQGREDGLGGANVAVLSGIAKRPSTFPAETIRHEVSQIVAAQNQVEGDE